MKPAREIPPINPHWATFFKRVRELAAIARRLEAEAQSNKRDFVGDQLNK